MLFLERLAEERILQALERGEFDNLPGKGKPIPTEDAMQFLPEEMRTVYRILKNSGYVPEEVRLLRDIDDLVHWLDTEQDDAGSRRDGIKRIHLLMARLGDLRGGNLASLDGYFRRLVAKLEGSG